MDSGNAKEKEKLGFDLNLSLEESSSGLGFHDFIGEEKQPQNDHVGHDFGRGSREICPDVEMNDFSSSKRLRYTIEDKGKAKVDFSGGGQLDLYLDLDLSGFEKDPIGGKMDTWPLDDGFLSLGPVTHDFFPDSQERYDQVENYEFSRNAETFEHRKAVALSTVRARKLRRSMQHEVAKNVASRLAHLGPEEHLKQQKEKKDQLRVFDLKLESDSDDSESPFSLGMEAVKMRQNVQKGSLTGSQESFFKWMPADTKRCHALKHNVPTLLDLSLNALAKNAGAIVSLELVPDQLRHRLSQLVSNCGLVNAHFVKLLARGSPTEIRLKNMSQLTEEEFVKIFSVCDTKDLTVLQLDLCGRCLPDYVLPDTLARLSYRLARLSHRLPSLATISLEGAHRLSDDGLSQLVVSAPALQSINLSRCSLITSQGIIDLARYFECTLRELYIDDCQNIDAMIILPALKRLKCLEVLSVAGIETVRDVFVIGLVKECGIKLKGLRFANCIELTDISLGIVARNCPNLCALDLSCLHKLTDSALRHLANGCQSIRRLKFQRNGFSDEAIAAFLEASGQSLDVLSLNNINRVAHNTAFSIAKCSRNLSSLDLSWCRKLTDEALGLIVESCLSLKLLKLFGCTQITEAFLNGHTNHRVRIIGGKSGPVLEHLDVFEPQETSLWYCPVTKFC